MRIMLFLLTNFAVIALVGVIMSVFGISTLQANGIDIDLQGTLIMCALFGFSGSLISLFLSKTIAKRSAGVQLIETPQNQTERWLYDTVADISQRAGIKTPEVGIFPSAQPNAFATGWNKNAALVAVSAGLLQNMKPNEVRAVLAHEVAHVANGDMVTLTLIQGVVNTFVLFFSRIIGHVVDRAVFKTQRGYGPGYYIVSIIAQLVLGILASMIVMWFSRYREFRADEGGAKYADRQSMIGALEALKRGSEMPDEMPENLAAFGIGSGRKRGLRELFSSHPPLDVRIEALRANAARPS